MDEIARLLMQQMALLDISEDLKASEDDDAHIKKKKSIRYVLDENVFEYMLSPSFQTYAQTGFYSRLWRSGDGTPLAIAASIEAQTAMLTAEWILSGTLPGASSTLLSMTDHHRNELAKRANDMNTKVGNHPERHSPELDKKIRLKKLVSEVVSGLHDHQAIEVDKAVADIIEEDCTLLKAGGVDEDVLKLFRSMRKIASVLAEDDFFEWIVQLKRLFSSKIYGRTISLETAYALEGPARDEVLVQAREWSGRIEEELLKPGNRRRFRSQSHELRHLDERSREEEIGSKWNDAWALALVQWLADHNTDPDLRIVFVTGDQLLVDTYRRWYYLTEKDTDRPYIIRRFAQYAPHFNPRDTGGAISTVPDSDLMSLNLFDSVQRAIESSIIPWLGKSGGKPKMELDPYGPQTLTLVQSDMPEFVNDPSLRAVIQDSISDQSQLTTEWASIMEGWRRIQRISIGSAVGLIGWRTGDHAAVLSRLKSLDDADSLKRYVEELLQELSDESAKLWLPGARKIIQDLRNITNPRHIPAVSFDALSLDTRLDTSPAEVTFAAAAYLSMEGGDIANAIRYADLAVKSDQAARASDSGLADFHPDLLFLSAVTHRYGIAALGRHFSLADAGEASLSAVLRSIQAVKDSYSTARRLLREALGYHQARIAAAVSEEEATAHELRHLRAMSERAALYLFYATSVGVPRSAVAPALRQYELVREAKQAAAFGINDLMLCDQVFRKLNRSPLIQGEEKKILALVEMQFTINMVSMIDLRTILEGYFANPFDGTPREILQRAKKLSRDFGIRHAVAVAEFAAFELASGLSKPENVRRAMKDVSEDDSDIPLDRLWFRVLQERIIQSKRFNRD